MKGVIIAGGTGSRLYPLTKVINKNILAVYDKPLIYYPILTFLDAGIKEILIISGRGHAGQYLDLLGAGTQFGIKLSYEIQEFTGGIAQAIGLARSFADGEKILVILGDNIYQERLTNAVEAFLSQENGAKVFVKEVKDPKRFGVPKINEDKIVEIIEKPEIPPTNYAVTGLYMYDERAFEIINTLKPSARGEIEVTDLNNYYAREGTLSYQILKGEWIDAGTFDSLLHANLFIARNIKNLPQFHFKEEYPINNKNT